VLLDAVLAFQLLRVGGLIIFDDYLWEHDPTTPPDHYELPKPAIDAFVNINRRKLKLFKLPTSQIYAQKTAD
jgi:hypothetical protein